MKMLWSALGASAFCLTLVVAAPTTPLAAQVPPPTDVSWQSAGDSYSSGEGVPGNEGACAQSQAAFGPAAADILRTRGWRITGETFTACTGHLVEDYFNARSGSSRSLWDWGREQGGPERVDVITMSFGGNDIGFADVIVGCVVGLPDSWGSFLNQPACDAEDELDARVEALLDPSRRNCTGLRSDGGGAFDCDLDLGDRRGSLIDFYYDVVTQRVTDRGRLVIVGYPRIFADVNQWPSWVKVSCELVKRGDTEKLGRVAEHLNNNLQEAVRRANDALGSERVLFVDRFAAYRDGLHELCGTNEDWLNGLLFSRGQGFEIRQESSFHPNYEGHEGIAPLVADRLDGAFPRPQPTTTTTARPSFTPLPLRPVEYSERDAFRSMLNPTEVPQNHALDENGRCFTIDVWGWSESGDADLMVQYNPEFASHGGPCGGDAFGALYVLRDGQVVLSASACDCGEGDVASFSDLRDALAPSPASSLLLFTDSDGYEGWYVFTIESP